MERKILQQMNEVTYLGSILSIEEIYEIDPELV